MHPELQDYFEHQRAEQQRLVRAAEVQKTLRETLEVMHDTYERAVLRGVRMEETAAKAEELEQASRDFANQAAAANGCRCWPTWWCKQGDPPVYRRKRASE